MQHQRPRDQDHRKHRIKKHGALYIPATGICWLKMPTLEINTSFQLERDGKQYNVMANQNTISSYLNEDIFQYKENMDELTEKLLLLEKVDFQLSSNGQMITKMVDYQEKPDQQTNED